VIHIRLITRFIAFIFLIIFIPACNKRKETEESLLYNFTDSVKIIRTLIETKAVNKIIEDANQSDLDFLINNWSPAEFAFESEVLNCTLPVLVYYYENQNNDRTLLEAIAQKYKDCIKVVIIDAMQFPKIAQLEEVIKYPILVLVNKRNIIASINDSTVEAIEQLIQNLNNQN
jgi:hypothetical protein